MLVELRALGAALLLAAGLLAVPAANAYESRVVAQRARDLVFDPVSGKLYASVPASAGANGNSVRAIDPVTGELGPAVFVGSEPNRLTISDDGTTLYVGLDGSFSIRRVALPGLTPGIEFLVQDPGSGPLFPRRAFDIEVQPGHPDVIAVVRGHPNTPHTAPLAIFDNGVMRPHTLGLFSNGPVAIEFSGDPSLLYAFYTGFDRMRVDEDGVSEISSRLYLQDFRSFERFDGRIYSAAGYVYDIATDLHLGRYAANAYDVVADPPAGRVYFLYAGAIVVFDLERFVPLDVIEVEMLGIPGSLVQWGSHGLAFSTDAGQIILVDTTPPDADADGAIDRWDNCAGDANADQADSDADGVGDACDPHPGDSESELAQCTADQLEVAGERTLCEAEPRFVDVDGDGEHDAMDRCPATPPGHAVDEAGCSLAEFCSAQAAGSCKRADWGNDEPRGKSKDCVRLGSKRGGYRCVPG